MSLLSPAYIVAPRGRLQGRRRRRGRRVYYANEQLDAGDEYYDDAEGSYSDSDDAESFYDNFDETGEEYYDDAYEIAEPQAAAAAAPAPAADAAADANKNFFLAKMKEHGMIGCDNPEAHPSAQAILPLKSGDDCADIVVLECVEVEPGCDDDKPAKDECDDESSSSGSSSCEDEPKPDPCYEEKEVDCTHDDDSEESLDNTISYDCWVAKGEKTNKKKKAHPDDCDEVPDVICAPVAKVKKSLAKAMKAGKPFQGRMKTKFAAESAVDKTAVAEQQVQLGISGKFEKGVYLLAVEMTPLDGKGKALTELKASAPLMKVKLDANKNFKARAFASGIKALKAQNVPLSAIQHAVMVVQDLV